MELADTDGIVSLLGGGAEANEVAPGIGEIGGDGGSGGAIYGNDAGGIALQGDVNGGFEVVKIQGVVSVGRGGEVAGIAVGRKGDADTDAGDAGLCVIAEVFEGCIFDIYGAGGEGDGGTA